MNLVDNNTGVASTGGQSYLSSSSISIEEPTKAQHRHSPSWNICKRLSAYSIFPRQSTSLAINSTKSGSKVNQDQPTPHAAEHNLNLIFNYGNYSFHISLTGFSFFSSLFFLSLPQNLAWVRPISMIYWKSTTNCARRSHKGSYLGSRVQKICWKW